MKHRNHGLASLLAGGFCAAAGFVSVASANDVSLSVHHYEFNTQFNGSDVKFKPTGGFVGASFDMGEAWKTRFTFGKAADEAALAGNGPGFAEVNSMFWSVGLGYTMGAWQFGLDYSRSEDEVDIHHGAQLEFLSTGDKDNDTANLHGSYAWEQGAWGHGLAADLQYSRTKTHSFLDQGNIEAQSQQHYWYVSAKVFVDHYFRFADDSGVYVGGSMNGFQELTSGGDDNSAATNQGQRPGNGPGRGGRNGGRGGGGGVSGASFNATSGEHFVLFGFYAVYEINRHWGLDFSSEFGALGDENANSYALTLSYYY